MARGYWEAKSIVEDDLDVEIQKRGFNRGYPRDNIIFEDSKTAVLIQNQATKQCGSDCSVLRPGDRLHRLIQTWLLDRISTAQK